MNQPPKNLPIAMLATHGKAPSVTHETLQNERKQNPHRVIGSFQGA